jgi:Ca2+-binding RTX toxin-like protein
MSPRRTAQVARRCAQAGVLLLAAQLTLAVPAAHPATAAWAPERAAPSCNGLTATIVGSPGVTLFGTSGNDVIVTKSATRVDAGAGDDSICVTGKGTAVVNAGPDDDFVGARTHKGKTIVSLGFGDDVFWGGNGDDLVWSQEASNQTSSDDHDVIDTAGGNDYVISGSSTAPNTDVVTLGPGDDELTTYGFSGGALLSGGLGTNAYQPLPGADVPGGWTGEWRFDNVLGAASLDDIERLEWRAFQKFDLRSLRGPRVRYFGSRADESVLAGGTCRVALRGRDGDDRLRVDSDGCNNLPAGDARIVGGAGNDLMYGAAGDDVLRGGSGTDTADGGFGSDDCIAEHAIAC